MKYKIEIELNYAAFQYGYEGQELSRILMELAVTCMTQKVGVEDFLKDINGNTVGKAGKGKEF